MMRVLIAASLAWVVASGAGASAAVAASAPPRAPPSCEDTAMTTPAMGACAAAALRKADAHLNTAYREIMRYVGGAERAKLVAAQRAWIAFRDADCAFFGDGDGELAPMDATYCRAALSEARARELDAWPPDSSRDALVPLKR